MLHCSRFVGFLLSVTDIVKRLPAWGCTAYHVECCIVHASLAFFCLLQILLGGCLGLQILSRSIVHTSLAFFCLLQILLGGPSCKQGCLCSKTLEAGNIITSS